MKENFIDLNKAIEDSSFEDQFAIREKFETAGGFAEVIDVRPEDPESLPVVIASAWAMGPDVYKGVLEEIFNKNMRGVSIGYGRDESATISQRDKAIYGDFAEAQIRKSISLNDILEQKKIDRIDMIGHSAGGPESVLFALMHPEKVRTLVLYGSAGLYGDDTFLQLFQRLGKQSQADYEGMRIPEGGVVSPVSADVIMKSMKEYVLKNPSLSYKEGKAAAASDIAPMIEALHARGVHVIVASPINDPVFPAGKMNELIKDHMVDGYLSIQGGHGIPEANVRGILGLMKTIEANEAAQNSDANPKSVGEASLSAGE